MDKINTPSCQCLYHHWIVYVPSLWFFLCVPLWDYQCAVCSTSCERRWLPSPHQYMSNQGRHSYVSLYAWISSCRYIAIITSISAICISKTTQNCILVQIQILERWSTFILLTEHRNRLRNHLTQHRSIAAFRQRNVIRHRLWKRLWSSFENETVTGQPKVYKRRIQTMTKTVRILELYYIGLLEFLFPVCWSHTCISIIREGYEWFNFWVSPVSSACRCWFVSCKTAKRDEYKKVTYAWGEHVVCLHMNPN